MRVASSAGEDSDLEKEVEAAALDLMAERKRELSFLAFEAGISFWVCAFPVAPGLTTAPLYKKNKIKSNIIKFGSCVFY